MRLFSYSVLTPSQMMVIRVVSHANQDFGTARLRYKREIDREKKKKSTFDLTTDNGACLGCLPQISPFTLDVTTNKYLYSAAGDAKIYCAQKETQIFNVAISNELFD